MVAVPFLVLVKGGDALSVCFNTIAILFLTEVTNMLKQENIRFKICATYAAALCGRLITWRTRWA
jgi:hypothetical protein